jgi:3-oxoadipate enol-lactonase
MSFIQANGLNMHYAWSGRADGPVLLFVNSLGTNFHVWDPQAAFLADRFRILRYDMRGHGLTDCPPVPEGGPGYTIDMLADDALGLLDALKVKRAHVCGLSIGGLVAQRVAAKAGDRVASLVLCDTANRIGPPEIWKDRIAAVHKGGTAAIAGGVMQRWFTPPFLAERKAEAAGMVNMLTRTPTDGYVGCCYALRDADLRADDAKITAPTLVIVGDQDAATSPALAKELSEAIKGARLEIVTGAAHIPTIEQPAAINRLLGDFLGAQRAAAAE